MATTPTPQQPDGRETRAVTSALELRSAAAEGTERTAAGYAALFGSRTNVGGYFTEEIAPGAFAKSLQEDDIIAIHSHSSARIVGRKGAGTLSLREDAKGLAFENRLPDTNDGRDLVVLIDRGDIAGMSFGFSATRQEWDDTVDPPHRKVLEARLYEITYCAAPQYTDTEVALRTLEGARAERRDHNKTAASIRISQRRARLKQAERNIR